MVVPPPAVPREPGQTPARPATQPKPWAPAFLAVVLLAWIAMMLSVVYVRIDYTPLVQLEDAPAALFSEARAHVHVVQLASVIGDRQVSTPGLAVATNYLLLELDKLQKLAAGRDDVQAEVIKHTVSGAVGMTFTNINFTNAYRALDNVALLITPTGREGVKAVLIVSHYDSAVCSKGAADDGAQAAIMLELARTVLSRPGLPDTPLMFLWTGGEEPISPAAHGWGQQSGLVDRVGAFINLEAMGGGGLPIIFQHTGSWVLEAYARGCPMPRGSRVAQDIFDLQILPADSDFRMFSARHYGSLPGLDIAFLLGSTNYHTYLDTPENLKPGIMQEEGESLLGGVYSISAALAARQVMALSDAEENQAALQRSVYFDILSVYMVRYSDKMADLLHMVPLPLLISMPVGMFGSRPGSEVMAGTFLRNMLIAGLRAVGSLLLGVVGPALLGAARAIITGKPMIYFANQWIGYVIYLPISAALVLVPWIGTHARTTKSVPLNQGEYMASQIAGVGLCVGAVGSALTLAGMRGNAFIFCMMSLLCFIVGAATASSARFEQWIMMTALGLSTVPLAVGGSIVMVFLRVMMERTAISGWSEVLGVTLGDVIVGALSGASILAVTCGCFLPMLAYCMGTRPHLVIGRLMMVSLVGAMVLSRQYPAYTPVAPKRAAVNHIFHTELDLRPGAVGPEGGLAMMIMRESIAIAGTDSTPISQAVQTSLFQAVAPTGREYAALYPLDSMLDKGMSVLPPCSPEQMAARKVVGVACFGRPHASRDLSHAGRPLHLDYPPFLQTMSIEDLPPAAEGQASRRRVNLRLYSQLPCWGVLNVSGPTTLHAWSLTKQLSPSPLCQGSGPCTAQQHVVRFVSQDPDPYWSLWVEVDQPQSGGINSTATTGGKCTAADEHCASTDTFTDASAPATGVESSGRLGLRLELHVSYLHRTPTLLRTLAMLPDYVTETWLASVYTSSWDL